MTDLTGQIGLTRTRGWFGRLIRWADHSTVNHAIVYLGHFDGVDVVMSAEPHGARLRQTTEFGPIRWSQFTFPNPDGPLTAAQWALNAEGSPYNFIDDVAIGLVRVLRWHAPATVIRRLSRKDRLQCAQLSDLALQAGGVHAFEDHVPGDVTPGDFERLYNTNRWP
jgi:hypothetical protein